MLYDMNSPVAPYNAVELGLSLIPVASLAGYNYLNQSWLSTNWAQKKELMCDQKDISNTRKKFILERTFAKIRPQDSVWNNPPS